MTLEGRRVLVTGGGTGLGASLARGFAAAGAEVIVCGRRREPLDAIASSTPGVRAVVADVTDETHVAALYREAGHVDVVIANAGAARSAPLHRTTTELWHEMLGANLTGTFLTLREGYTQLRGHEWGRLITIASTAGLRGYAYVSAYTAAKHGAVGLTRAIAAEVDGTGLTANALCPGYLDTEMTDRTVDNIVATTGRSRDEAIAALAADNPQGRLIHPDEVTAVALALCTPDRAHVNGAAIEIDGGEW
ncbi:MAG: SDR family NAD(P)-dependent oxidoreductase [Ilumatobacteraceae bacterium]